MYAIAQQAGNEAALAVGFAVWFVGALGLVVSLRHFVSRTPDAEDVS